MHSFYILGLSQMTEIFKLKPSLFCVSNETCQGKHTFFLLVEELAPPEHNFFLLNCLFLSKRSGGYYVTFIASSGFTYANLDFILP